MLDREQAGANAEFTAHRVREAGTRGRGRVRRTGGHRAVGERLANNSRTIVQGPRPGAPRHSTSHFSEQQLLGGRGAARARARGRRHGPARGDLLQPSSASRRALFCGNRAASLAMMKRSTEQQDTHLTAMRDRRGRARTPTSRACAAEGGPHQWSSPPTPRRGRGQESRRGPLLAVEQGNSGRRPLREPVGDLAEGGRAAWRCARLGRRRHRPGPRAWFIEAKDQPLAHRTVRSRS